VALSAAPSWVWRGGGDERIFDRPQRRSCGLLRVPATRHLRQPGSTFRARRSSSAPRRPRCRSGSGGLTA